MDQFVGRDEIESLSRLSVSGLSSTGDIDFGEELMFQWAEINRLPTNDRLRYSLFNENIDGEGGEKGSNKRVVDVTKLGAPESRMLMEKLIKHIEHDNLRLLHKMRKRMDKVGVKMPTIEVRYRNLRVEAECEVVYGKPLPTLWNSLKSTLLMALTRLPGLLSPRAHVDIINNVSGIIKPGRITLLLGPPGCGKTTLLKALSGNLDKSLKDTGDISFNGYKLDEFIPQKTSAYISQDDLHIPVMSVRETIDFSARCQGIGSREEIMTELTRREKEADIVPDPDIDTYMKAVAVEGQKRNIQTEYILKILGLDVCADTVYGDAMRRGISGGQKKRLTTGEMIVGPTKALFMDEISNGLDSSTTYQIICCLQQLAHITDATIFVSLLQPSPETFDLFDDVVLMGEGKIIFHGPRNEVLDFFNDCGFKCPERKGVADFLQEVISRKDQEQYWANRERPYRYVSVDAFSRKYRESDHGKKLDDELVSPFVKYESHKNAISFKVYSLPKWTLFKACMSRELLLMKRNSFVYIFKLVQLLFIAFVTMTVFLRTQMGVDSVHANGYLGALFFSLNILLIDGMPELSMTVERLPMFEKQRDLCFYPAWAYAIPYTILKIPLSILEAVMWTCLTYYVIGYSPEPDRFFRNLIVVIFVHLSVVSMFRFLASIFRSVVASTSAGSLAILFVILFGGFMIPRPSMPVWLKWAFWLSPMSYGEIGLSAIEFLAPRWQKKLSEKTTIGNQTLEDRGLNFGGNMFWISVLALCGYTVFFDVGFTLSLTFLKSSGSRAIISSDQLSKLRKSKEDNHVNGELIISAAKSEKMTPKG